MSGRLTEFPRAVAVDALKVAPLAFRRLGEQILVSGENGDYIALSPADFERFLSGGVAKDEALWKDLQSKGFIKDHIDFNAAASKALERKLLVWGGPCVHRLVLAEGGKRMSLETARAIVDRAFASPAGGLTFELSGGEPLSNWPAVMFLARYARLRSEKSGRTAVVVLDVPADGSGAERLDALLKQKVVLRFEFAGTASEGFKSALAATSGEHEGFAPKPQALVRVSAALRGQERAFVEALIRAGVETVDFLRSATSPEDFVAFYKAALETLIKAGLKGKKLRDARALACARRILAGQQWSNPERESFDRIAYDVEGGLHLFDEGPGAGFAEEFSVHPSASIAGAVSSPAFRAGLTASQLAGQPLCSQCAYRPYCGASPASGLQAQGTLWGRTPSSDACRVHMGVFDYLFQRFQEWEVREKLLPQWLAATT